VTVLKQVTFKAVCTGGIKLFLKMSEKGGKYSRARAEYVEIE